MADKPKKIVRKLVMPSDTEKGREEAYEYEAEEQTIPEQDIAAEETVPRPTRKVTRKMRMPAAAKRGGYEVPEETTEEVEEIDPATLGQARDPKTGKPYEGAPEGVESANWLGPVDEFVDPTEKLIGVGGKTAPFLLGMLRRPKGKLINPKNLPLESMVRTPLAAVNKEFAKKAMSPEEEIVRRGALDYIHAVDYPKENRIEAIKDAVEISRKQGNLQKSKAAGLVYRNYEDIDDSSAQKIISNRGYVLDSSSGRSPSLVKEHEGLHVLLGPKDSIQDQRGLLRTTAYEKILNKEVPRDTKVNMDFLMDQLGYSEHSRATELIPFLATVINKQVSLDNVPNVRTLTKEQYTQLKKEARELHEFKKIITKGFVGDKEKQWNEFMRDAKKAYNAVLDRAEKLTPEEIAEVEQKILQKSSTKSKPVPSAPQSAAMKGPAPDVDEDLGLTMERLKQVTPELGKEKGRSIMQRIADPFLEFLEDRKNRKWSEQYSKDRRAHIKQQLEERRRNRFMKAEERRKTIEEAGTPIEGGTKPPTEIE